MLDDVSLALEHMRCLDHLLDFHKVGGVSNSERLLRGISNQLEDWLPMCKIMTVSKCQVRWNGSRLLEGSHDLHELIC